MEIKFCKRHTSAYFENLFNELYSQLKHNSTNNKGKPEETLESYSNSDQKNNRGWFIESPSLVDLFDLYGLFHLLTAPHRIRIMPLKELTFTLMKICIGILLIFAISCTPSIDLMKSKFGKS